MTTKNEEAKQWMAERIKTRQEKKKDIPFSVVRYKHMKSDGMSDAKIMEKHGLNPVQLNKWKNEHNLIGKHNAKTVQKERGEVVEVKVENDEAKQQNATQEVVEVSEQDKMIEHLKQVNERQLADNQKLAEENERLHKKLQEAAFPALEEELQKWKSDHAEMSERYIETRDDAVELSEKLVEVQCELDIRNSEYALLENQLANATKRIEDLKRIESDYMQLERDFLNERGEKERMVRMLDRLKHTEQINVWLMEQHVAFHAQLDEVTA